METFDFQVKMFTEQLVDLIEQAKSQAALEFQAERSNWEQTVREYEATITGLDSQIDKLAGDKEALELKLETLRSKITALV